MGIAGLFWSYWSEQLPVFRTLIGHLPAVLNQCWARLAGSGQ
ncbi:hypothetical protein UCMB321_5282 [Pseudomonas batumici]|uniref:Uncharacterized protein n=1 Tax=Pseudomonas batumici TaxID=226910 RepID=A0A0C2E594_9PSED|nr:hypothetical protein UCMB321_5282 [Pseudomonas batumici]